MKGLLSSIIRSRRSLYLLAEDFEGTGKPSGWGSAGSPNWDYTTSPIVGAQSLFLPKGSAGSNYSTRGFTNTGAEIWLFCRLRRDGTASSSGQTILGISNVATWAVQLNSRTDGSFQLYSDSQIGVTGVYSNGSNLAVWIRYVRGTGANCVVTLYISNGSEVRGSAVLSTSAAVSTRTASMVHFQTISGADIVIDKVRVSATAIGSNPI